MATESTSNNAPAAAASAPAAAPAASPTPTSVASEIKAIRANPEFFKRDSPTQKQLVARLAELTAMPEANEPILERPGAKKLPEVPAAEARRRELTTKIVTKQYKDEAEKNELVRQLKILVNNDVTDEEKIVQGDRTVYDRRKMFGIEGAPERLTPDLANQFDADWGDWEHPLYDLAAQEGLAAPMVRDIRDEALNLGEIVADRGTPLTNAELKAAFDKLKVPESARAKLAQLWRALEGGGGA